MAWMSYGVISEILFFRQILSNPKDKLTGNEVVKNKGWSFVISFRGFVF